MKSQQLAGVVAATAAIFTLGGVPSASAANNVQVVGIEETLRDPNGTEIAYTVTRIFPSAAPVAYPVGGRLYEATVMARAIHGMVVPVVPSFNARAGSGTNYPVIANVSSLSGMPLAPGSATTGTLYFDVTGDAPTSVVYNNGAEDLLTWVQAGEPMPGGSTDGGGGSTGGGGSEGVPGSTGPNNASPDTSGGEAGNTGEDGVEGGGGNLETGGGSGAVDADTGS